MNDLKLQEGLQPIDKHLRPIKVGDEVSALEISTEDVRVSRDMFLGGSITTKAINSDSDITLNAVNDVNIPVNVGLTFGDDGEKIEGNGLDLTISSSRHLTIDIAGVLVSDSALGTFQFLDDGDSDDLFQITVAGGTGATTLETTSADTDGIMHIKAEGDTIELESESYIKCANPIQMNEVANAVGDNAGYGQIWVKNSTPNELYFTTDAGDDIQLTSGTSVAGGGGGGSDKWIFVCSMRGYTRYDNWWHPSTLYGISFYNWSSGNVASLPTSWSDDRNPCLVVPVGCTLTDYYIIGNFTSSQDYEFALLKGGAVTHGSYGNYSLTQVGSTQSISATSQIQYKIGQSSLSVSLAVDDILVPCIRRTSTDTSSYYYFEGNFRIVATLS